MLTKQLHKRLAAVLAAGTLALFGVAACEAEPVEDPAEDPLQEEEPVDPAEDTEDGVES